MILAKIRTTLTDKSKVYDVRMWDDNSAYLHTFNCLNEDAADQLITALGLHIPETTGERVTTLPDVEE